MLQPFTCVPKAERSEHRARYRDYLAERDGALDAERRQLSRREARMRELDGIAAFRSLDRQLFGVQYVDFDPERPTPVDVLILLALVKINAAEAYGVNTTFEKSLERVELGHEDDTELTLLVEETYHTRILLSATRIYGFDATEPYTPPLGLRTMIGTMGNVPMALTRPLVLASELLGTIYFTNLFFLVGKLLAHDPELRDALQERLVEVLVDEVGHVSFNRLCLGPFGLAQARAIMPLVARTMHGLAPEMEKLGLGPSTDFSILEKLPEEVQRQAFVV